ncbi:Crp/Fnr family transcriptional regulator [Mesonia sp. MT50]|uniref:Crp/Fnr family transcriptional regulator n=1 Tax=Mesonia profundi TaxID=3070998 RepID=A0ABU1A361_9FLAO|nr:Crp/Fnr family transcriptional regulator [Mesonia profundi]MDQ7918153.1 Crp/Fnr family transcriptional regulator [Mesonia profundi]
MIQILEHVEKVIPLSDKEKEEFLSILQKVSLKKKSYLIQPGEQVNSEYYVVKGSLMAFYLDENDQQHMIQFSIEDWWISDFEAFFKEEPAQLYVQANEDCELLAIDKTALETLYQRIPAFERFFRIKTTGVFVSLRQRILSSLRKNGKERYMEFCAQYPLMEKRFPNYQIANYLGLKPESLSRIRKELA